MLSGGHPQPIPEITDALFEQEVLKSPVPVLVMLWKHGWWYGDLDVLIELCIAVMRMVAQNGYVKLYQMNVRKNAYPRKIDYQFTPSIHVFKHGDHFDTGMKESQYQNDCAKFRSGKPTQMERILNEIVFGRLAKQGESAKGLQRLRARQQEPPGPRMSTAQIKAKLIETDGLICQGCDRTFDDPRYLEVDHIVPRTDGGVDHISNRVLLCRPCNVLKSNKYTLSGLRRENARRGKMAKSGR